MARRKPVFKTWVQTATVNDEVSITGLDFTPGAIIAWTNGRNDASDYISGSSGEMWFTFGFGHSPTERRSIGMQQGHNNNKRGHEVIRNDALIGLVNSSSADHGRIDIKSFNSDGVTFITDSTLGPGSVKCFCIILPAGTKWKIVDFSNPNATGNQDITGAGFDPTMAIGGGNIGTAFNSFKERITSFIFAVDSTPNMWGAGICTDYDAGANQSRYAAGQKNNGLWIGNYNGSTRNHERADTPVWITDGLRLNWITNNYTLTTYKHTIMFGDYENFNVGSEDTINTLDADVTYSGFGFPPFATFLCSPMFNFNTTTGQLDRGWSWGGFDSPTNRALIAGGQDDSPGDLFRGWVSTQFDQVQMKNTNQSSPGYEGETDVQSLDSGGFTLNIDNPDSLICRMFNMSFGDIGGDNSQVMIIGSMIWDAVNRNRRKIRLPELDKPGWWKKDGVLQPQEQELAVI